MSTTKRTDVKEQRLRLRQPLGRDDAFLDRIGVRNVHLRIGGGQLGDRLAFAFGGQQRLGARLSLAVGEHNLGFLVSGGWRGVDRSESP